MQQRKYSWIPDLPDGRDHLFAMRALPHASPLVNVDFRKTAKVPAIVDQGQLGSCTGNSSAYAFGFDLLNNHAGKGQLFAEPSRLFIYYNGRSIEGTIKQDAGAQIRDVIKGIAEYGAPPETEWPYVITKFATKPPAKAFLDGAAFKAVSYQRLDNSNKGLLVNCLAQGFPFVFGFTVYDSFESAAVAKSGIVPMPNLKKEKVLGGHAVCAVGYDVASDTFIVANSWGTGWGQKGYFTIPAAYLTNTNMADDFWQISTIL